MSPDVVIQKSIGIMAVLLFVLFFSPLQMALCISFFGQGHFITAYVYQWRAGKMTRWRLLLFFTLITSLFGAALTFARFEILITAIIGLFLMHHFHDEVTLSHASKASFRPFEQLLLIVPLMSTTIDATFSTHLITTALILLAVVCLALGIAFMRSLYRPDVLSFYFFALAVLVTSVVVTVPATLASPKLIGGFILYHYVCWYIYYWQRLRSNHTERLRYLQTIGTIHIVLSIVFVIYISSLPGVYVLTFLFAPAFFYIWAAVHILSSLLPKAVARHV
jgi:hypothetical protein